MFDLDKNQTLINFIIVSCLTFKQIKFVKNKVNQVSSQMIHLLNKVKSK